MNGEPEVGGAGGEAAAVIAAMLREITGDPLAAERVAVVGEGSLPSAFPVTELATASIGAAALALADLVAAPESSGASSAVAAPRVTVDRRLASFWFGSSLRPEGWQPPPLWDPIAGDYRAADRWIRLHTNAPVHRAAALRVLGLADGSPDRDRVAAEVAGWVAQDLETAVVAAGGCAAVMRSSAEWAAGEQGRSVAAEPLIAWSDTGSGPYTDGVFPAADPSRPLAGVRVLDLTRVLAGPVATRFLAQAGADVLRIDPLDWDEPGVIPDVMLGKRSARLDLRTVAGRTTLLDLLAHADVLVHGYRPGALDGLGLGEVIRRATRPGLVEVALDAYGWTGPWAGRRGFDSLVQMSTGIAETGMRTFDREAPTPLPVQALDHATGYLMAYATLRALGDRRITGRGRAARLSLARTARLLKEHAPRNDTARAARAVAAPLAPESVADVAPAVEATGWGPAHRLRLPFTIDGVELAPPSPARSLGSDLPTWL